MTQEALKLALEALELCNGAETVEGVVIYTDKAITAIKEALAQPEQEPVGQLLEDAFGRGQVMWFNKPKDESMLYTTPPQRTEPVIDKSAAIRIATVLGWTPPRTWVGLTDEEISEVLGSDIHDEPSGELRFIRAIEAKLKANNFA